VRPHLATLVDDLRRHGSQIAIVSYRGNRRVASTYAELASLADRVSRELERRHIQVGDRVILWGQNGAEWIASFFGCVLRGIVIVPLDAGGGGAFAERVIAETRPQLIIGDRVLLAALSSPTPQLFFEDFDATLLHQTSAATMELALDTPLQIVFTSGTTAEPKGIVHTHRNILASIEPIEREIQKYLKYERMVHPVRFLHTLPLSHVFGQFMGLWIPSLLAAEVHFENRLQAQRLLETIRRERISVLVAVPRVPGLLKSHLEGVYPALSEQIAAAGDQKLWRRWWRFRALHRKVGLKFWAFVCGGASLPSDLEQFWTTLGFALIQGYGMTETAALVTLNHPFHVGKGTIGKPLPGREVRIGPDGEMLVRGDMIATATWSGGQINRRSDAWLSTGDLASQDQQGQFHFLGRKSEVIVTAAGLNVHPEDLEAALNAQPNVQSSVVIPHQGINGSEPLAVLLVRGDMADARVAVAAANLTLAEFQRIRHIRLWPGLDFPRTSTGKIRRSEIVRWSVAQPGEAGNTHVTGPDTLLNLIAAITGVAPECGDDDASLTDDLYLDSLGRVQLQADLERLGISLSDSMLEQVTTLGQLRQLAGMTRVTEGTSAATAQTSNTAAQSDSYVYPRWPWIWPLRSLRIVFVECIMRPLVALLAAPVVHGSNLLAQGPIIVIANHVTRFDVPLILYSLPPALRRRTAVAMAGDMIQDWRHARNQGAWWLNLFAPIQYLLVAALFNIFPLARSAGFRRSFAHIGEALDRGYNLIIFPEGHRSMEGTLQPFRPGIGLLALESNAAILPIALHGLGTLKKERMGWFHSGRIAVRFGSLVHIDTTRSPEAISAELQRTIDELLRIE